MLRLFSDYRVRKGSAGSQQCSRRLAQRDDVVVLNVEVRFTLDTTASVALEHRLPDLARDDFAAQLARQGIGRNNRAGAFELALFAAVAFIDERLNVPRGQVIFIPVKAPLIPPVLPTLVVPDEQPHRLCLLRFDGLRKFVGVDAADGLLPEVEVVPLPKPRAFQHETGVLRITQHVNSLRKQRSG